MIHLIAPVAQRIEYLASNQGVAGPPSTFTCPCGEMDITTVFGTVIAGSNPAKGK